ncbi:hypothetical protein PVAP13_1NG176519 [Panicum virgatum]|uniref:Uncharacterized protein n=1 Tax=Panicum virgatum TaxID=38727 RepID=A0A8T0WTB5_PANVG|nr:hypothetical protein PVAP13_1NG176519 [Panicum virgatum]
MMMMMMKWPESNQVGNRAWHGMAGEGSNRRHAWPLACRLVLAAMHASIPLLQSLCLDVGFTGGWAPLLCLSGFVALLFQLVAAAAFVLFRFIYPWTIGACVHAW